MQCESVSIQLAAVVDDELELPTETGRHVEGCLRCQAELAQYRKLIRALQTLRYELADVDELLLEEILDGLRPIASVHRLHRLNYRNKKVAIGGIAAAATAGAAAGAIVIASKLAHRQRLAS
ncbi:MAG: hypothetical protein AAF531_19545 [Actinomycetota bacterium]